MGVRHHTKTKGDIGVAHAAADLTERGHVVCWPATEHAPFDLVTYKDGRFWRVQVKYRALKGGIMFVELRSVWSNRSGSHSVPVDRREIDLVCVYCPDTRRCYYFDPATLGTSTRIRPAEGNGVEP